MSNNEELDENDCFVEISTQCDFELNFYQSYKKTNRKIYKPLNLNFVLKPIGSDKFAITRHDVKYIIVCPKIIVYSDNWKAYDVIKDNSESNDEENKYDDGCYSDDGYEVIDTTSINTISVDSDSSEGDEGLTDICKQKNVNIAEKPEDATIEQVLIVKALFYHNLQDHVARISVSKCNGEELLNKGINVFHYKLSYNTYCKYMTQWEYHNILMEQDDVRLLLLKIIKKTSILVGRRITDVLKFFEIDHQVALDFNIVEMETISKNNATPEYWRSLVRHRLIECAKEPTQDKNVWIKLSTLKLINYYLSQKYFIKKPKLKQICNPLQYKKELIHLAPTREYKQKSKK
uniref:FLYWCH-type domain-containing protein n=1 Tax=Rhabditophanes sp. KR3021 TaxID=114890 RepID=A0AC35TQE4_9BILA